MLPQWIIEKKRDGNPLTPEEIRFFIHGYTCGNIPDYQMSALAMAIFFRGMSFDETVALTDYRIKVQAKQFWRFLADVQAIRRGAKDAQKRSPS